jgi:hypothetical protein
MAASPSRASRSAARAKSVHLIARAIPHGCPRRNEGGSRYNVVAVALESEPAAGKGGQPFYLHPPERTRHERSR